MSKIIAVTGSTGAQGSGVVNVMKKVPGWKIRALTRNTHSDAAKKLAEEGVEVVQASFDNEASLAKAFEGVHVIYAVTNWWEQLFAGKSADEAGVIEEEQGMKLARAAARTPTLEHYIWSTTPSAKRMFNGQEVSPHMDYKANVDARIKSELPELAKKTTYLYFGYYPQNLAFFPCMKPIEYPGSGKYVQFMPTKPTAKTLVSGDMSVNPGIWVRQAIAHAPATYGKYANVALEKLTFQEMIEQWSEVTGKEALFLECTAESYTKLWGPLGQELSLQFRFGELCDPWEETEEYVSAKDLGIDPDEVVGFKGTIEGLKQFFT
ncbi:NAD(P)-binding protein [Whalleya microplaca]|nr:NAD(P)-binding protein [Whalleya microplaca]